MRLVRHAAASGWARPILSSILLELDPLEEGEGPRGRAVAADNYRIAEAGFRPELPVEEPLTPVPYVPGQIVVPVTAYPLVRAFLHHHRAQQLAVAYDAETRLVQFTAVVEHESIAVRAVDGQYPNYHPVLDEQLAAFTQPSEAMREIAVDTAFFPMWAGPKHSGSIVMRFKGALQPILLAKDGYREVVMPVRGTEHLLGDEP